MSTRTRTTHIISTLIALTTRPAHHTPTGIATKNSLTPIRTTRTSTTATLIELSWRGFSEGEVYGMKIMQEMRELGVHLSPGTLYPALHALLGEKDVKVTKRVVNGKGRKCYRATAKGRKEVEEVIERLSFLVRKMFC